MPLVLIGPAASLWMHPSGMWHAPDCACLLCDHAERTLRKKVWLTSPASRTPNAASAALPDMPDVPPADLERMLAGRKVVRG